MLFKVGLALLAAGAVGIGVGATAFKPVDLAIAGGWHVTVFVPATLAGALSALVGAAILVAAAFRAKRSAQGRAAGI